MRFVGQRFEDDKVRLDANDFEDCEFVNCEIEFAGGELFAFAGLWESWREPGTGEDLHSFTIVTTEPNEVVAPIHNRMPAMLREGDEGRWLDPDATEYDELRPMLAPYPAELMEAYPVSARVNRPGVDAPDLIVPVANHP